MGRVAEVKHGGHKCVLFRLDSALNRVVTVPTIRFENEGRQVSCIKGASLRRAALDDGINIYKGLNNVSNCGGLGQCGTCVMRVLEGAQNLSPRTAVEEMYLADFPAEYRLSCRTCVNGNVTVEVRPERTAADSGNSLVGAVRSLLRKR